MSGPPQGLWGIVVDGVWRLLSIATDAKGSLVSSSLYPDPITGSWDNERRELLFHIPYDDLGNGENYTGYLISDAKGGAVALAGIAELRIGDGRPAKVAGWYAFPYSTRDILYTDW